MVFWTESLVLCRKGCDVMDRAQHVLYKYTGCYMHCTRCNTFNTHALQDVLHAIHMSVMQYTLSVRKFI